MRALGSALLLSLSLGLALAAPVRAQSRPALAEADDIVVKLRSGTRLQRSLGAIALRHLIKREGGFSLFTSTAPRWWQTRMAPALPNLIQMLGDDSGLEWVDQNGVTEQTTTPRQEAVQALEALGRIAVEPLIDALDRPVVGPHAAEVLRRIVPDAPASVDPATWRAWWTAQQTRPLPGEHGRWWQVAIALLLVAGGASLVVWRQRAIEKRPPALYTSADK